MLSDSLYCREKNPEDVKTLLEGSCQIIQIKLPCFICSQIVQIKLQFICNASVRVFVKQVLFWLFMAVRVVNREAFGMEMFPLN